MQLRRSYLEVSHQLENANEEVRGLSLRLQENVSIEYWVTSPISFGDMRPHVSVICPVTKTESVANLLYSFLFYLISYGCGASKYTHTQIVRFNTKTNKFKINSKITYRTYPSTA